MNEVQLIERFRAEKKFLETYGDFVSNKLSDAIVSSLKINPDSFFKIPIKFRLKEEDSLIQKAFYRNKSYSDPYNEITDKVGGRIVVLLEEQANQICGVIEKLEDFSFSKDRDFETERATHPELFNYKSHHYILRNKNEISIGEIIPEGTPVEIQIRTLLQHAYSELTHDTIYKPNTAASPEVRRYVAKSMALIEVTDQLFSQVSNSLKLSEHQFSKIIEDCLKLLPDDIGIHIDIDLCNFILDAYLLEVEQYNQSSLKKFVNEYNFILEKIKERSAYKYLFRQPVILFLYHLVLTKRKIAKARWPLSIKDIEEVFTDLGFSYDKS